MQQVQDQLPFSIETPSDSDVFERFHKEAMQEIAQGNRNPRGFGAPSKATKNARKRQRKARAKNRA